MFVSMEDNGVECGADASPEELALFTEDAVAPEELAPSTGQSK